jgi:hypothetical protein
MIRRSSPVISKPPIDPQAAGNVVPLCQQILAGWRAGANALLTKRMFEAPNDHVGRTSVLALRERRLGTLRAGLFIRWSSQQAGWSNSTAGSFQPESK